MSQKVALITGASSGIGAEFARQLAADGMDIVLVARRQKRLEEIAAEIEAQTGRACHVVAKDLGTADGAKALHAETQRRHWRVEWLVNNAGFGTWGRFSDLPLDRELEEIGLNVTGLVGLTRCYLPDMLHRRSGQIVNVSSMAAFQPVPYMATYAATKAFVLSFSQALAAELDGSGVRVLAVCPGLTKTEFQEVAGVEELAPQALFMTAAEVARESIAAAKAGKDVVVNGLLNKAVVAGTGMIPNRVLTWVTSRAFRPAAK